MRDVLSFVDFGDQLRIQGVNCKGFGILPKYVMLDPDLTIEAKTIYAYFCSFAGNGNSTFVERPSKNGVSFNANRLIKPEVLQEGWQTSGSNRITRLAFQLFTDGTPTAITFDEKDNSQEDFRECQFYSVSDIFCCENAPFFVEAVKLRYPYYFSPRKVYRK